MPAGVTPAVTVVCFLLLVNFRHASGGRGPRQAQWCLRGGQRQCQQHSGFARNLIPQCGWAQAGPAHTPARGAAARLWDGPRLGKQESGSLSSSFVIFQLCELENVA